MGSTTNTLRSGASWSVVAIAAPLALLTTAARADVTISSGATQNMTCSGGVCIPTAKKAVLNVSDLEGMLASGSVEVKTKKLAKNIKVVASLTWATSKTLALDAYDSIAFDAPVSVTGRGGIALTTDDGGSTGTLSFYKKGHVAFSKLSSVLTINGSAYALANSIATLAGDIASNPSGNYALAKNYNAAGDGTYPSAPIATQFTGTFEGLGNTISNLTIVDGTQEGASDGLFNQIIGPSGAVRDLGLVNVSVTSTGGQGGNSVGTLAGFSSGTFWRVFATGALSCGDFCAAGGLVASGVAPISQSHADVTIDCGVNYAACNAGGLVGSYGANNVMISQSYATGAITVAGTGAGGGSVGGLVGGIGAAGISQSYATGAVSLTDPNTYFSYGGVAGSNSSTISQSYSTGKVSVPNSDCAGNMCVGGLIGFDASSPGSLTDTYWDTDTSGITNLSQGAGNIANDPGITGLTTAQFQSGLPTGFDPKVWAEKATINGGLPYLLANPPPK